MGKRVETNLNKYGAKKTTFYGITFDSKAEAKFYLYLLSKFGKDDIVLQPEFILQERFIDESGNSIRQIKYKADFYVKSFGIYIDVKGMVLPTFILKCKMLKRKYPDITLIYGACDALIIDIEYRIKNNLKFVEGVKKI